MKTILIGYGEVGNAAHLAWGEFHKMFIHDPAKNFYCYEGDWHVDVMLVSIPYSKTFVQDVVHYKEIFFPKVTIVLSTVPIGTCSQIVAVHSPIEARHDNRDVMYQYLKENIRWIGGEDETARAFFEQCGIDCKVFPKPEITEFLKLRSLALYGVNIEMARYSAFSASRLGFDYEICKEYDREYNRLNVALGLPDFQRYVLDSPGFLEPIGGHCVLQNMVILEKQLSHPFLNTILGINDFLAGAKKRRETLK